MDIKGCDLVFKITGLLKNEEESDKKDSSHFITLENSGILTDEKLKGNKNQAFVEMSRLTWENIATLLLLSKNESIKKQLVTLIKSLKNTYSKRPRTIKDIRNNLIIGNYKSSALKLKYFDKKFKWPNLITPYNPDVLLVDKLSLNGVSVRDVVHGTDANGNTVFVLTDSEGSILKFINYLTTRDLILNKFLDLPELEDVLAEVNKGDKHFNNQLEMLLDFQLNNSDYVNLGKGYYGILTDTLANLRNEFRGVYGSVIDSEFNAKLDRVGKSNTRVLSKKKFMLLVNDFAPELIEDLTKELLKDPEVMTLLYNDFMGYLVGTPGKLIEFNGKNFIIQSTYSSIGNRYGCNYSLMKNLFTLVSDKKYKGYNIYKYTLDDTVLYTYTADIISPESTATMYKSIEDVKNAIDYNYSSKKTKMLDFDPYLYLTPKYERIHLIFTNKAVYATGRILNILDISLGRGTITLDEEEKKLFSSKDPMGLDDFFKAFEWQLRPDLYDTLVKTIDNIEAAGLFTYLINQKAGAKSKARHLKEDNIFLEVIDEISKAQYQRLYVQKGALRKGASKDVAFDSPAKVPLSVIPIDGDVLNDQTYNDRPTPIIGLINEVIDVFNKQFGVGATMLTLEEIDELFPNEIPAGTKAFIRNGQIFINGTIATSADVVHEYTHLVLGALKAKDFNNYRQLMNKMIAAKDTDAHIRNTVAKVRRAYPNLAESDFYEEVFAAAFGDFLAGRSSSNMFKSVELEANKEMKGILSLASEEEFNLLYKMPVNAVFNAFSKEIGKLGKGLDFSQGAIYRKAANWIAELLDEEKGGDLIEKCQ